MSVSTHLDLPYLAPAQAQKHVTHNEALRRLDALVQLAVATRDAGDPPADPQDGARHIVGRPATGAWAGQEDAVALYETGTWSFFAPRPGWRAWVAAEGALVVHDGTGWQATGGGGAMPESVARLGINASADAVNRLAVSADATLLNHAGAGHQLKINKASAVDTASLLFQTGFSGRAEMGLAGVEGFSVKVSADGTAWTEALRIDPETGHLAGAAVQSAPFDATPGRLMRADYGYGPATVLGDVGLSGGVPTGAVLERGPGYLRLACGTQIARADVTLTRADAAHLAARWTYPRPFATAPQVTATLDLDSTGGVTPGPEALLAPGLRDRDGMGVDLALYRVAGGGDFASGENCVLSVVAVGDWA